MYHPNATAVFNSEVIFDSLFETYEVYDEGKITQ